MNLDLNTSEPRIMHIDLNSCFTTIEQQANRLLRNRPVGVAAYDSPRGFVLAASYPAKAKGVKLGVTNAEAKVLAPGITIMTPDPSKYREAHKRFKEILLDYTSDVSPKSIDEFVLDLSGSPVLRSGQSVEAIGLEIKQKIYARLGEAVTVNIGIATNRFLAKYAAGFDKPNGLTIITHENLISKYNGMSLVDLPGINVRYQARLHAAGIMTPLDFLAASERTLKKVVFKSVVGSYWYKRLRGWEVDAREFSRKSIGHQYALKQKTTDRLELEKLLMKLCEKVGRRLRSSNYYAGGIHLYLGFEQLKDGIPKHLDYGGHVAGGFETTPYFKSWHKGRKLTNRLYSSKDIFLAAKQLLHEADIPSNVKLMSVNVYDIVPWDPEQLNLFEADRLLSANKHLSNAIDKINNRYGEFKVTPATMADMQGTILDRIAFGGIQDM
ncbi:hypothetical protein H6798_00105 [Candidatus Nomurabacteria bacterium]|nr:hypothetical protein [Candidatus Nomurabacteria bacterium]